MGGSGTAAGTAFASMFMQNPVFQFANAPGGDIDIAASNDGMLDVSAVARATGANGIALAQIHYGFSQFASAAGGGDAHVGFVNGGTMNDTVAAHGHGTAAGGLRSER